MSLAGSEDSISDLEELLGWMEVFGLLSDITLILTVFRGELCEFLHLNCCHRKEPDLAQVSLQVLQEVCFGAQISLSLSKSKEPRQV